MPRRERQPPPETLDEARRRLVELEARLAELEAECERDTSAPRLPGATGLPGDGDGRRIEQALRASEATLRGILDATSESVWLFDVDGVACMANQTALARLGRTAEETLGRCIPELVPPDVARLRQERLRQVVETGKPLEFEDRRDGTDFQHRFYPVFDPAGLVTHVAIFSQDVTRRRQVEQELRASVEAERRTSTLLRALAEAMPDPAFVKDRESRLLLANPATLALLGRTEEQALGRDDTELYPDPATGAAIMENDRRVMRSGEPAVVEERVHDPAGDRYYLSSKAPYRDAEGRIAGIVGVARDVTERRKAEQALRETERRFRLALRNAPVSVAAQDRDLRYIWAYNQRTVRPEQVIGRTDADIFTPAEAARLSAIKRQVIAEAVEVREQMWLDRPGGRMFLDVYFEPLRDDEGLIVGVGTATVDLTAMKLAEEASRRNEEQFRALIENVSAGVALIDETGRFSLYNRQFLVLFGLAADSTIHNVNDQDWSAWQVFDERGGLLHVDHHPVRKAVLARRAVREELVRVRLPGDGGERWMLVSAEPLFEADGRLQRVICTYNDITERKRVEEELARSEAKYRDLFLNLAEEVHFWRLVRDERGEILTWRLVAANPPALRTWGRTLEEVEGRTTDELFGPGSTDHYMPVVRRIMAEGVPYSFEDYFPNLDRHFRFTSIPLGEHFITTGADITAIKRAIIQVQEANVRLTEADERKNEFLAMLSHELRNPLAPIRNSLYVLQKAAPGGEQTRRAQEVIDRQVGHMTRLIDDLLDVTRITRGKIQLERVRLDLDALAHGTVEDHRSVFADRGVQLDLSPAPGPVWVLGDRTRIAQVMGNLLLNAAKFTPPGGSTTVRVGTDPPRAEAVLTVRDTGSGIAPEIMPRLFEAFTQADRTLDRSQGGLGLGLALVKGLVEMHGGRIEARSEGLGRGAEFTVRLPLDTPAAESAAPAPHAAEAAATRRVLVVEDNPDSADSLREALSFGGHVTEVAYSGPEAVEKARSFGPDVVLCDIGLPGMDGYEVARILRADPGLGRVTLVALSGYARPEDVARAHEAGFDAHLSKPTSIEELEGVLREAGRARARGEGQA